jgi:hypothetical protein
MFENLSEEGPVPEDDITKGEQIDAYHRMADRILPYMEERPVMLQRFPDGLGDSGFYQKQVSDYFPDWIRKSGSSVCFWIICATVTAKPRSSLMPFPD